MLNALEGILSRPKTVLTMMFVLVIAGIFAFISIPKEANPDIDVPVYFVNVAQQGISPSDAERLLVRPLETELRGLDGLKELTAIAAEGYAAVVLEFNIGTDKDKVLADIRDKVDQAKAKLPADADEPSVAETNFALQPTIIVTLSGQLPERALYGFARKLKDELEAISTVREANLKGNREELLEVVLDLVKLESYDITQGELLTALAQNNQLVPAGFIDDGKGRFNVKVPGLVENGADVFSIPVKQNGEGVVRLGDVAKIRRTFKDPSVFTRVNGEPAISVEVVKRIGTNIIENNKSVRETVARFSKDWPNTVKVNFMLDESSFISEVQGSLQASIMTAIALVMIVVVGALGVRSGMLVGLSIPLSFVVGFLILSFLGMTVNMMVMFGLVLTVGMLVDGAIVVTEYADRKMAEGAPPSEAYSRAAKLMFWPVVASTATTLAAFLPLLLWPGVPGEFMSYLPIMVIIVLSASLMTALIFLPASGANFPVIVAAVVGVLCAVIASGLPFVPEDMQQLAMGGAFLAGAISTYWFAGLSPRVHRLSKLWALSLAISCGMLLIAAFALTMPIISGTVGFGLDVILDRAASLAAQQNVNIAAQYLLYAIVAVATIPFALLIMPVIAAVLRRSERRSKEPDEAARMLSSDAELDLEKMPGVTGGYLRFLNKVAGTLFGNVVAIALLIGFTVGVFTLFGKFNNGVEFFVDEEPDQAIVLVSGRGNLSAYEIRDLVSEVEVQVMKIKGIENVVMSATAPGGGGGIGNALGGVQDKPADVIGELQIELTDYCCRRKAVEIFKEIRTRTAGLAGIKVEVRKIEGGPPTGKDLRLEVKSSDYNDMVNTIAQVRAKVDAIEDLQDREDSRPLPGIEWQLKVNREEAGRYNAGIGAIGAMVQLVTNGVLIGKYRPDDAEDEVEIRVRVPEEERSFDMLDQIRLRTQNGQVPLSNFVERTPQQKLSSITRRDGLYAMDVKANLIKGSKITVDGNERDLTPDDKVKELQTWLDAQQWPSSVQLKFRGSDEEQKESGEFLGKAAAGALFLMFIILVTQFNSFYQTFLTLSTVILAVVGVLIGLMISGQKFSIIMTGTGVVALAGIVVNNAIVLIDTFNRLRSEGVPIRDAVLKTSAQRMRPIMLTTITTILGLIPMAYTVNINFIERIIAVGGITSIWWVQLSTAVISGLAFSTVLTLILIPVMLLFPHNVMRNWDRIANGFKAIGSAIAGLFARASKPAAQTYSDTAPETLPDAVSMESLDSSPELTPVDEHEVVQTAAAALEKSAPQTASQTAPLTPQPADPISQPVQKPEAEAKPQNVVPIKPKKASKKKADTAPLKSGPSALPEAAE